MHFLVSKEYRFLLGWSAKCGCSSVKDWFLRTHNADFTIGDLHQVAGYSGEDSGKSTQYSKIDWSSALHYRKYKKFLVVRNPYHRLVSGFLNKYVRGKFANLGWDNFSEFVHILADDPALKIVNRHHFAPQFSEDYDNFKKYYSFDAVIQLENLAEGLNSISSSTGASNVNPVKINTSRYGTHTDSADNVHCWSIAQLRHSSPKPPLENFYDIELAQLTEKIYQLDFDNMLRLGIRYPRPITDRSVGD